MPSLLKKGTETQVEIKFSTVLREVLCNNYQSHNLIGPYHFWGISPRNLTVHQTVSRREACTGWARDYESTWSLPMGG